MIHRIAPVLFVLAVALECAGIGCAQQPFFMGLGDLPGGDFYSRAIDVSADGSVVVGLSVVDTGISHHFRWTREAGMVGLGVGRGDDTHKVSADGTTIVGNHSFFPGLGFPAYRWRNETGAVYFPENFGRSNLVSVSGDGSVVASSEYNPQAETYAAARWTEADGVEVLPPLPASKSVDYKGWLATDISADGTVVVGRLLPKGSIPPSAILVWSDVDGYSFIDLPGQLGTDGTWLKISDNGQVVTSRLNTGVGFRWTKETGVTELGSLPDGRRINANGVSGDGSIIVGDSLGSGVAQAPVIWDAVHGPRYLRDVLVNEYGLGDALAGWDLNSNGGTLARASGVSGDGRTVVGFGTNPSGNREAWVAYLGSPLRPFGDFNYDGTVDAADYIVWRRGMSTVYTQADYDTWRAHFGQTAASGVATRSGESIASLPSAPGSAESSLPTVPEPNSLALIIIAAACRLIVSPSRRLSKNRC